MKKILAIMTAVAFAAGSLGFIGCGGAVKEDPDAAKNSAEEKPMPGDDDPDGDLGSKGEKNFTPKDKGQPDEGDGGTGEDE